MDQRSEQSRGEDQLRVCHRVMSVFGGFIEADPGRTKEVSEMLQETLCKERKNQKSRSRRPITDIAHDRE